MTKKLLLYTILAAIFLFTAAAFYSHLGELPRRLTERSYDHRIPFVSIVSNQTIVFAAPEAEQAGLQVNDRIVAINGRSVDSEIREEFENSRLFGGEMKLTVLRGEDGETHDIAVPIIKIERNAGYYFRQVAGYLYNYAFPLLCVLLGFWVVLVRPTDYLAWLLLFLLLGISAIGLEGFNQSQILGSYKTVFVGSWSLSMFLFGIYFPERFILDRKLPWLKWMIIVPLAYQILTLLNGQLKMYSGLGLLDFLSPFNRTIMGYFIVINMLAIGLFFACLGWKSGTLENPDARRRLRVMVWGTSVAILPFFLLMVYKIVSGARGSFYDVAPGWFAFLALSLMMLFPLTMAYVIVVDRAMDVSVVVRQGLQYALATGGVRIVQFLLLLGIGFAVMWSITNYGSKISIQIAFIVGGIALVPLVDKAAKPLRLWIDKRFFREAYDAEMILSELSDDVRTMIETKPLLETVAGRISESLHIPQVTLLMKNGANFVPAYALGFDTPPVVSLSGDSKSMRKLGNNQHIVLYDDMTEVTSTPTMSLNDQEQLRELNSQILLPLAVKNQLSGIISLSPKRSEEPYTPSDLRLLRSVASQTGLALENSRLTEAFAKEAAQKERLNAEIEIAREVQERLFPQELPPIEGLDYYGACRPALGVGGDYYDFLELPDGKFGIAIGDVSGKGIGASLMMASLQASLRGQAIHSGDDLASMMSHINRLVYETSTTNRYATFFYAQFDPTTRRLSYVNAGHNPPLLIRNDGSVETLEVGGPVIGMLPPIIVSYEMGTVDLQSDDMLVGFTDGISEAMNPLEEEWGEDAMLEELKKITDKPSVEILPHIVAAADRFADGAKQHDDMTMIIVRLLAEN